MRRVDPVAKVFHLNEDGDSKWQAMFIVDDEVCCIVEGAAGYHLTEEVCHVTATGLEESIPDAGCGGFSERGMDDALAGFANRVRHLS